MFIQYHEPLGEYKLQDPLPADWQMREALEGPMPRRFGVVEEGKVYRSGLVFPKQVRELHSRYGVCNIVTLLEGDWLSEFYADKHITIHQFPYRRRNALTPGRGYDIATKIRTMDDPMLVCCRRGVTRTGMVVAWLQYLNGESRISVSLNAARGKCNLRTLWEIWNYQPFLENIQRDVL